MKENKFLDIEKDFNTVNSNVNEEECRDIREIAGDGEVLAGGPRRAVYEVSLPNLGKKKYALKRQIVDEYELRLLPSIKYKNKKTYVFSTEHEKEYLIGRLLGSSYMNMDCINFFNVYDYKDCNGEYYTLMDKVSGTFKSGANCMPLINYNIASNDEDIFINSMVQVLFAIAYYQTKWKISHNDLHSNNIFVEYVNEETTYKGEKLINADYYHYKVGSKDFYIHASPVIVKIGDYGLAEKYSEPVIISEYSYCDGNEIMACKHAGGWETIPPEYIPQYDSFVAVSSVFDDIYPGKVKRVKRKGGKRKGGKRKGRKRTKSSSNNNIIDATYKYIRSSCPEDIFRPYKNKKLLCDLKKSPTALDYFINSGIPDKFSKKPTSGNIITIGTIEIPSESSKNNDTEVIDKRLALTANGNAIRGVNFFKHTVEIDVLEKYQKQVPKRNYTAMEHRMRKAVTDWLLKIARELDISYECFGCAVYMYDTYLAMDEKREVNLPLQLLGIASMKVAIDYYMSKGLSFYWASDFTGRDYTQEEVKLFARKILKLGDNLLYTSTPYHFVSHYSKSLFGNKFELLSFDKYYNFDKYYVKTYRQWRRSMPESSEDDLKEIMVTTFRKSYPEKSTEVVIDIISKFIVNNDFSLTYKPNEIAIAACLMADDAVDPKKLEVVLENVSKDTISNIKFLMSPPHMSPEVD